MSKSYEEQVLWGQEIREMVVEHKLARGLTELTDEELKLVLAATKDHSSIAIAQKRNQIEQDNGQSSSDVLKLMAEFVAMQKNGNPFERQAGEDLPPRAPLEEIPLEALGEHKLAPGEGQQGTISETVDEFDKRMRPQMADKDN